MGRSVDYLTNASHVAYIHVEQYYQDEDDNTVFDEFVMDDTVENLVYALMEKYPSLQKVQDEWDGRETRIVLRNRLVEFGVSEYCGMLSVSVRHYDSDYTSHLSGLAENWIRRNAETIDVTIGANSRRIGGMSNGCSVYESI